MMTKMEDIVVAVDVHDPESSEVTIIVNLSKKLGGNAFHEMYLMNNM